MADKIYSVNQESPDSIVGFENFNSQDVSLINSFEVNTLFNPDKNFMELHVVSLIDELLESEYNYTSYKQLGNAQSAGNSGASVLTLDPVADVKRYGYENGSVKLLYHFLNDLFSETKTPVEFFIESISEDRTELRLQTLQLTADKIVQRVAEVQSKLQDQSYFSEFRLDFKNNDLFIGINIDTVDLGFDKAVVVKLYEPLPINYVEKSTLTIVELIADSVAYEVDYEVTEDEPVNFSLKPANFSLEVTDDHVIPTGYFNYEELFAYPVNNSNSQIYTMINQKGVELSIDHTDYANFIHFSSAQERLLNFKYKLDLISSSYANIDTIGNATTGITGVSGSQTYYNGIIEGILKNFDHYERFLYYESGSYSWPKSNNTKPYVNQSSLTVESTNWFTNQLTEAVRYDLSNYNSVLSAIPSYIKDDENNEGYLTFLFMIGQHFDLLWIYAKAVSDKYDADNRLEYGIPKDLVSEALKNFGVKLYTSNKSIEDLFTTITGQPYQSGSEVINTYVTGSLTGSNTPIQPASYDSYTKEVQKRIYHNLPFLLKSKGTERGLRALINCFGIPSEILQVKLYGGQSTLDRPFYGDFTYYTSSLDKIRLDSTGSIVTGSTLSQHTSTVKQDKKYTDDLHSVEVGFSPTDSVDSLIVSHSLANTGSLGLFSIDSYIGDPRNLHNTEYAILNSSGDTLTTLNDLTNQITSNLTAYNLYDYVRLIKFFDNTIFKMVKDFVPARTVADTGIIIKPHLLQRSKAKSPVVTVTQPEFSQSIDTAFASASNGNSFGSRDQYTTVTLFDSGNPLTNFRTIQTPIGLGADYRHGHEESKFDGDFSGSNVTVTNGNLTQANPYTVENFTALNYNIVLVSGSDTICLLGTVNTPIQIQPDEVTQVSSFFSGTSPYTQYTASVDGIDVVYPVFPYTFTDDNFEQYDEVTLHATSSNVTNCQTTVVGMYASCSVEILPGVPQQLVPGYGYNIAAWFTPFNTNIGYYITNPAGTTSEVSPSEAVNYIFTGNAGDLYTVEVRDIPMTNFGLECKRSVTRQLNGGCPITLPTDGTLYYFNDTEYFEANESGDPKTYKICRRTMSGPVNTTPTIRSLFATGTTDAQTEFKVQLVFQGTLSSQTAFINPGDGSITNTVTTPWSGNEEFELKYLSDGEGYWTWEISNGVFGGGGNFWATYGSSPLDQASYIEITAYNNNTELYGTCQQSVRIKPPRVLPPLSDTCQEGVDFTCEFNSVTNQYEAVSTGIRTCFSLENPCNYLNI
jgi:hypothetical protein